MSQFLERVASEGEFSAGLQLLNLQDQVKFQQLLTRILKQESNIRSGTASGQLFTDSEKQKLVSVLDGIGSIDELDSLLKMVQLVIEECIYFVAKPNLVHSRLVELQLREDLSLTFATSWSESAKDLVAAERRRSALISAETTLVKVDYSINASLAEPSAVFKLNLLHDEVRQEENVQLEMNSEELLKFYQQLEMIQIKLDSLK